MSTRSQALSLYKRILQAHKTRLPQHLQQLGDAYVREEFKRHKKADPKWLKNFFTEWNAYVADLEKQKIMEGPVGKDLSPDAFQALSDEQKAQLATLRNEATHLYKDG